MPQSLIFILAVILLDTIGMGLIIPVMPELITELTGEGLGGAARYGGVLMTIYAIMQLIFAPILGNLSDRFGRRPVLLVSLGALGIDYLIMAWAPSLFWLFLGRMLAGIAGATYATANAYVVDISSPEDRAKNFGRIGAAWGLGFILGPVIGGFLGDFGLRAPFYAAAGLSFLTLLYGLLVLPESLGAEHRRPFSWARANPIGTLAQMRRFPLVLAMFPPLICYAVAHDANPSTWSYYTMLKFEWTPKELGYSLGAVGIGVMIVQAGLVGLFVSRLGEVRTVYFGFAMLAIGYLGFSLSNTTWQMVAFIVPFSLGCVAMPALRSLMAGQIAADAQGELQGAISSLFSLTMIVAPLFMTQLFGFFTSDAAPIYFPGAPFFTAGVLMVLGTGLFARALQRHPPAEVATEAA